MNRQDPILRKALEAAVAARENAYAPYSKFKVGAALVTRSGKIFPGCNVENASFGATICAERGAILSAHAAGERDYRFIVVVTGAEPPSVPCALCLQVMAEFCPPDFEIYLAGPKGIERETKLGDLLPHPFREIP
jgi:homotetrameric cytidine deaminase